MYADLWCRKPAFQSSPHVYACALHMHKILVVLRDEMTSPFGPVLPAAKHLNTISIYLGCVRTLPPRYLDLGRIFRNANSFIQVRQKRQVLIGNAPWRPYFLSLTCAVYHFYLF